MQFLPRKISNSCAGYNVPEMYSITREDEWSTVQKNQTGVKVLDARNAIAKPQGSS